MSDGKTFFKIVVLNHNKMTFIKKCLDSILSQSFQDFVVVVVDNASNDLSNEIINIYEKHNTNIKCIYLTDKKNIVDAYNIGINFNFKQYEYALFINSTEILNNNTLNTIYNDIINSNFPKILKYELQNIYDIQCLTDDTQYFICNEYCLRHDAVHNFALNMQNYAITTYKSNTNKKQFAIRA